MDFIAEMVLGYADTLIIEKLKEIERNKDYEILHKDYEILRYRDDFKIFVNTPKVSVFAN
jgi:hypothetical protein